jgi:hypothetical protein
MTALWEKVEEVNRLLDAKGIKAVQEIKGAGRTLYGFLPQAVFDAMNQVFGDGWGYEVVEYKESQLGDKGMNSYGLVRVRVWVKPEPDKEPVSREAFGGSRNNSIGDALKGAVTDAVQKGLAMFSVGRMAYEGELGHYYQCYQKIAEKLKAGDSAVKKAYSEFVKKHGLGRLREWPLSKLAEFCEEYKIK